MSPAAIGITVAVVALGLVVVAIILFFADDKNRVAAKQKQQDELEQSYRMRLGEFADIDEEHMTDEIHARMTQAQENDWYALQLEKKRYATEQKLSLNLFGPESVGAKFKRLMKLLGIAALFGLVMLIAFSLDDVFNLKSHRGMPATLTIVIVLYLLVMVVRSRLALRASRSRKSGGST